MILNPLSRRVRRGVSASLLFATALSLAACASPPPPAATHTVVPHRVELLSGDGQALSYTQWYVDSFEIAGPVGTGIGGGGSNVMPIREEGRPSESGGMCCTSYPLDWQSDLRLTVRWLVFKDVKKLGAKAPGYWYKAENVQIAKYDGHQAGGIWAIFLPDDRVRLMIADGNSSGGNDLNHRP
ncbi:DUF3304 domain-containing protein, partial [Caballeronia sp.]|uniref:DUF3304 domain-containing protein n=1 Tax=Caballeronia sp. TaxID=1931223 RepID=UPI003C698CAC